MRRDLGTLAVVIVGFCLLPCGARSDPPPGYYDSVDTTSSEALRQTLHEVIDDHQRFPYSATSTDTWDILEAADEDPGNPDNILDVYKNASYLVRTTANTPGRVPTVFPTTARRTTPIPTVITCFCVTSPITVTARTNRFEIAAPSARKE